jgi:hypothetical protein
MGKVNSLVYREDWEEELQRELDEPTIYEEICKVEISNSYLVHNPYMTDPTVITGLRGTSYTYQSVSQTDESVTINTFKIVPQIIDRADLAQKSYADQMALAKRQAVKLKETIEAAVYADHGNMTDFGDNSGTYEADETTQITVAVSNIDDIIRGVRREIIEADGLSLFNENGGFFVWRPDDFEKLEAFIQANGFNTADRALENGPVRGIRYMGFDHYTSNQLSANHVVAGVKKAPWLGILKATFGQIIRVEEPDSTSAIGVVTRADFKPKIWTRMKPVVFDINVA